MSQDAPRSVENVADSSDIAVQPVEFSAAAQTSRGGWGYVSAKDGNDFDEGSTCVTQVQGLRACRNAGIPVYAVSAIAEDPNEMRAHGQDERIRVRSFYDALEYWYRLVKTLAQEVLNSTSLPMAWVSEGGITSQPSRQPVIAQLLEKLLITMIRVSSLT